jgi:hypothetical protein
MDKNVKARVVQHQPRHDVLELFALEDDVELGNRMWAYWFITEGPGLDGKSADDGFPQGFCDLSGICVVVDMGMLASYFSHQCSPVGFAGHQVRPTPVAVLRSTAATMLM